MKHTAQTMRVLVTGGGGFIGSHLAKRLKSEGHFVRVADIKPLQYMDPNDVCDEFCRCDLRNVTAWPPLLDSIDWVFHLAADMGGMGFIQSNHSTILVNNASITLGLLKALPNSVVKRLFYASSACVYPVHLQDKPGKAALGLRESDAWPAQPQDAYGLEKLFGEEAILWYALDHPELIVRIARYHNIYGPQGTWCGGREKAPAAFCRKALVSTKDFEMWGDGQQTRSFCYIDDCVELTLKLFHCDNADAVQPLNIGSDEMVTMNEMAQMVLCIANKPELPIRHVRGPEGVRGRNSDNTLCKSLLGAAPTIPLADGLERTYAWIREQVEAGGSASSHNADSLASSKVV